LGSKSVPRLTRLRRWLHRATGRVAGQSAEAALANNREGHTRLAWFLLLLSPGLLASNMLVSRLAAGWIPPVSLTFWRWVFVGLLLTAVVSPAVRASLATIRRELRGLLLLGSIGMTLCGASAYLAGQTTTTVNIGLIYAASPVLMALLARSFLHERLDPSRLTGIALCLAGIAVIIARGTPRTLVELSFNTGDLWALSGSAGWAVYSFLQIWIKSELPVNVRLAIMALAGALVTAPLAWIESTQVGGFPFTGQGVALLAFTVLVASYGSYVVYAKLQRLGGVSFAGLSTYLSPLWAALLGWLFMNETLEGYHFAGAALVFPGIWLAGRRPQWRNQ
jgi:drug/metabolite transporter (DMT)-like permease